MPTHPWRNTSPSDTKKPFVALRRWEPEGKEWKVPMRLRCGGIALANSDCDAVDLLLPVIYDELRKLEAWFTRVESGVIASAD